MIHFPEPDNLRSVLPARGAQYVMEFLSAGKVFNWPAELLASICFRESHFGEALRPRGPAGTGDKDHGRGLMQIDDRSHSEWLQKSDSNGLELWKIPGANIMKGAEVLDTCRRSLPYATLGAWVAAYNAGAGRVAGVLNGPPPHTVDRVTTGGDYSADVIDTAKIWHALCRGTGECDCGLCK